MPVISGKKHQTGNNVSHANNKTKRVFNPNLQRVKALVNGSALRFACARCLRVGLVKKSGLISPNASLPCSAP